MNITAGGQIVDAALNTSATSITLRTQNTEDAKKIAIANPPDQQRLFRGRWDGVNFHLDRVTEEPVTVSASVGVRQAVAPGEAVAPADPVAPVVSDADVARIAVMPIEDQKTIAGEHGIEWDDAASLDTMARLIAEKLATVPQTDPDAR